MRRIMPGIIKDIGFISSSSSLKFLGYKDEFCRQYIFMCMCILSAYLFKFCIVYLFIYLITFTTIFYLLHVLKHIQFSATILHMVQDE